MGLTSSSQPKPNFIQVKPKPYTNDINKLKRELTRYHLKSEDETQEQIDQKLDIQLNKVIIFSRFFQHLNFYTHTARWRTKRSEL